MPDFSDACEPKPTVAAVMERSFNRAKIVEDLQLFGVLANAKAPAKALKEQLVQLNIQDQGQVGVIGADMLVDGAPAHAPAAAAATNFQEGEVVAQNALLMLLQDKTKAPEEDEPENNALGWPCEDQLRSATSSAEDKLALAHDGVVDGGVDPVGVQKVQPGMDAAAAREKFIGTWSDVLSFFFATMLEHRAFEYGNFNVPNKEKWERIVKQVLQGPPERKWSQGADDRRPADRMIQKWNLHVEAQQTAGTGVPNFAFSSIGSRNKPGGRTSGMLGGGGGAKAAPKAAAALAAGAPAKTVGERQEIFDKTYMTYWWNVKTGATTCEKQRYAHQEEVSGVLMAFLREQPNQRSQIHPNSPGLRSR